MNESISIKKALIGLMDLREQLPKLYGRFPEYKPLVYLICSKDYLNDDNLKIPTFKELETEIGIPIHKLRKLIKNMYLKLFEYEDSLDLRFPEKEYRFYVKYYNNYASVIFKELNPMPKIGESVRIPFLKAKVGMDYFFVEDITHTYYDLKTIVDIKLQVGSYNLFWHFRKHEALEKGEISFHDYFNKSDWQLKEDIGVTKRWR